MLIDYAQSLTNVEIFGQGNLDLVREKSGKCQGILLSIICGNPVLYKYKTTDSLDKSESDYKDHDLKQVTWNNIRKSVEGLVPSYTCIFLDFIRAFGSYVKGLPKTKQCNSVSVYM